MDTRTWPIRPKWHRFESPRSYAQRQCQATGIPFDFFERGLTSPAQPYINRVWADEDEAAAIVEAAAGRPPGHFRRLKKLAQPAPEVEYPDRFLCRLCAAGEYVEQIGHDRESWCLRHSGQMVWVGPGATPESQLVMPLDRAQANAERRFRRLVASRRVDARLHARAWEMVRDNAWLTRPDGWTPALMHCLDDHEIRGRAALYPETVAVLALLSDAATVETWISLSSTDLRLAIAKALPPRSAPVDILIERIVLWLRPLRRKLRPTRIDPLDLPTDIVNTPTIIDTAAPYPLWIQRRPQAVAEWDWSRNSPARNPWGPHGTNTKAWWVCDHGHSWQAKPASRPKAGCPYCAGQWVWPGHTDLRTRYPTVAAEWDDAPGVNPGDPDHVGARSGRRANWICNKGHTWVAPITNRTRIGSGCPYCAGYRAWPGETDLLTLRPDLAAEWDKDRNGELSARAVSPGSSKKAWWKAACGHSWQSTIAKRTSGRGCPYCSRRRVLPGQTDLATVRPDLAAEWDASNSLTPDQVLPKSGRKVTWRCAQGHTWETSAHKRSAGRGCPHCAGNRVIPGETDLTTVRPDLAAEWDPSNSREPSQVKATSNRKATWRCKAGHIWEATPASRSKGRICPQCVALPASA